MLQGVDPTEALDLARLACEVGDEAPEAPSARRCSPCWRTPRTCRRTRTGPSRFMPVLPRLILAGLLVRTPDVPLPDVVTPVDVAARPKGSARPLRRSG